MINTKAQMLRDAIMVFLRAEGLETPLLEYRITQAWAEVMGKAINRYTTQVYVKNVVLTVQISSPALRQNLMMEHKRLAQKLNDYVGSHVISDVTFL